MDYIIRCIDHLCTYGEVINSELKNELILNKLKCQLYQICIEGIKPSDLSFKEIYDIYTGPEDADIKPIISKNFPTFGYYHVVLNPLEKSIDPSNALGDSIDDLCDIIKDLFEVRWRIINLGINDGLSYLRFVFKAHTEDHIVSLIGYINEIE